MENPYQYIHDKHSNRPYNDKKVKDGNFNYIHQTDAFSLADEIMRLRKELRKKGRQ